MNQWTGNGNGTTSFELNFGTITVPDEALDSAAIFSDITDYNSGSDRYHEYGMLHSTGYTTSDVSLNIMSQAFQANATPFGTGAYAFGNNGFAGPGWVNTYTFI